MRGKSRPTTSFSHLSQVSKKRCGAFCTRHKFVFFVEGSSGAAIRIYPRWRDLEIGYGAMESREDALATRAQQANRNNGTTHARSFFSLFMISDPLFMTLCVFVLIEG